MAWEWSHTVEAYENARQNMEELDRKTREIIAAEWLSYGESFAWQFDNKKYHRSLVRVSEWDDERLNDFIWVRTEEFRTCENGGHEAWCCPHGCGPHLVSFSRETEDNS